MINPKVLSKCSPADIRKFHSITYFLLYLLDVLNSVILNLRGKKIKNQTAKEGRN